MYIIYANIFAVADIQIISINLLIIIIIQINLHFD